MKDWNDMQQAEAMLIQAEQLRWYENTQWEQWIGRKDRKSQSEALAP